MPNAMSLGRFSIGVGDRFAHQARAQLRACMQAADAGVPVTPVWNKSNREHTIIGSEPAQTRAAADAAVRELQWLHAYFCDADHISRKTVERFLAPCDFFTIDVAEQIGSAADPPATEEFLRRHENLIGAIALPGLRSPLEVTRGDLERVARKYLAAVLEASATYRQIEGAKGTGSFLTEVSMDETDAPQTPAELLLILAGLADAGIPLATIAPKFTGRFNKGVDYVGDHAKFAEELEQDMAVAQYAVAAFGLPDDLKLSLHSGSDKFSIYGAVHAAMRKMDAGLHLKTAGTTWLEEAIGLAESGGDALELVKEIYNEALLHREELCAPYAAVIDIRVSALPHPDKAQGWTAEQWSAALRHDPQSPAYNSSLRQLMHVAFKIAAKKGPRYSALLEENEELVAKNVTRNLFDRHIRPVFVGEQIKPVTAERTERL